MAGRPLSGPVPVPVSPCGIWFHPGECCWMRKCQDTASRPVSPSICRQHSPGKAKTISLLKNELWNGLFLVVPSQTVRPSERCLFFDTIFSDNLFKRRRAGRGNKKVCLYSLAVIYTFDTPSFSFQLCTSVPMSSPSITFFRLPTTSMLKT